MKDGVTTVINFIDSPCCLDKVIWKSNRTLSLKNSCSFTCWFVYCPAGPFPVLLQHFLEGSLWASTPLRGNPVTAYGSSLQVFSFSPSLYVQSFLPSYLRESHSHVCPLTPPPCQSVCDFCFSAINSQLKGLQGNSKTLRIKLFLQNTHSQTTLDLSVSNLKWFLFTTQIENLQEQLRDKEK